MTPEEGVYLLDLEDVADELTREAVESLAVGRISGDQMRGYIGELVDALPGRRMVVESSGYDYMDGLGKGFKPGKILKKVVKPISKLAIVGAAAFASPVAGVIALKKAFPKLVKKIIPKSTKGKVALAAGAAGGALIVDTLLDQKPPPSGGGGGGGNGGGGGLMPSGPPEGAPPAAEAPKEEAPPGEGKGTPITTYLMYGVAAYVLASSLGIVGKGSRRR